VFLLLAMNATAPGTPSSLEDAVVCLESVLRDGPDFVSLERAEDKPFLFLGGPTVSYQKGVAYTFRTAAGAHRTIHIYLTQEIEGSIVPNGSTKLINRYQLDLPNSSTSDWLDWYPLPRETHPTPNETHYSIVYSPTHPLYRLWSALYSRCNIDNLNLRSPTP